jgi:hypothetical protein
MNTQHYDDVNDNTGTFFKLDTSKCSLQSTSQEKLPSNDFRITQEKINVDCGEWLAIHYILSFSDIMQLLVLLRMSLKTLAAVKFVRKKQLVLAVVRYIIYIHGYVIVIIIKHLMDNDQPVGVHCVFHFQKQSNNT